VKLLVESRDMTENVPRLARVSCRIIAIAVIISFRASIGAAEPARIAESGSQNPHAGNLAAELDEAEDENGPLVLPAGLRAEYTAATKTVTRIDTALRFSWKDEPADPRLLLGDFTARWTGKLLVVAPGVHTFHLFVAGGEARLTLDGKLLIERDVAEPQWLDTAALDLDYGHHTIEITFSRHGLAAQLGLYWSGARFQLERIPERYLFHDPQPSADEQFTQGRRLARGLRCANCHELPDVMPAPLAPSLERLAGNISRAWLMDWIGGRRAHPSADSGKKSTRDPDQADVHAKQSAHGAVAAGIAAQEIDDVKFRMPGLGLSREEARHIVAFLLDEKAVTTGVDPAHNSAQKGAEDGSENTADAQAGEQLFNSLGCLACHVMGDLGSPRLAGGGDLSTVGGKRPPDFFTRWLADPAQSNPAHRMPVFPLDDDERRDLAAYLAARVDEQPGKPPPNDEIEENQDGDVQRGVQLVTAHHCGACHALPAAPGVKPAALAAPQRRRLPKQTDWNRSCLGEPDVAHARPGYRLRPEQREAIIAYLSEMSHDAAPRHDDGRDPTSNHPFDGARIFAERNCTGCHSRGLAPGIAERLPAVAAAHPELARALAALAPPSLDDIGDKLERAAILQAVTTTVPPRRPWLKIRMPRFAFVAGEVEALADWLIAADRLPEHGMPARGSFAERPLDDESLSVAGRRLVTSEGFGCASCHQIGKSIPKQDNLAALGTDLSLVGQRIRRAWFDRWVRNPARIVPRMEMPAIEIPVPGVLDDALADQLAAVWHVLNRPGFTPPAAGALRVVRTRNMSDEPEPAAVLTDVLRVDKRAFVRPLVLGLPNRHSVLFDCEENRLAGWWLGDVARERTEGKRWFWEPGGTHVLAIASRGASELTIRQSGRVRDPIRSRQCAAELDAWRHVPGGVAFDYRLAFDSAGEGHRCELHVTQTVNAIPANTPNVRNGFRRRIEIQRAPADVEIQWRLLPADVAGRIQGQSFTTTDGAAGQVTVRLVEPAAALAVEAGSPVARLVANRDAKVIIFEAEYTSEVAADRYPTRLPAPAARPAVQLACVPGFDGIRLPLPITEMPTGFAWRRDGTLMFASLKGQVWLAPDSDGDGLPDGLRPLSDELAAPYGLADRGDAVDVINKNGLLRLSEFDAQGYAQRTEVVADGWGHTEDYHDWAVGLVGDGADGYYVALPCRQNQRSDASALMRGQGLHLLPRTPTSDDPRRYAVEPFCAGLRFPMGLAINRAGALFATDNQGNYNPFNELNHLVPGAHYGFFHKSESHAAAPERRDPAVEIPHPWTRSVNGICFLETPAALRAQSGKDMFGPWEGHLVGCEYDTRRLVRMSLEMVGTTYQGAVYPLSIEPAEGADTFEGPIACAIAPDGSLYVGNMRDSGWGAGQNTGSIVRLRPHGPLPGGIAVVRAAADGFTIQFAAPVVQQAAAKPANYSVVSYRRIPTADYGGPDIDRQDLRVRAVNLSADGQSARIEVDPLRAGFVYEIRVKNLAPPGEPFFPAEAYYTLRAVPNGGDSQ
jgi:mono/diheme cytochrome c family protein/glucose/arabinose dehydrogenase